MSEPTLRLLSLGAGVQSSALMLLVARGDLPQLDGAVFSDTGWEPAAVYAHLDRLEREVAQPAGIPVYRVSSGNIREDTLDPGHRFASMPVYIRNTDGTASVARRQCTSEYKLKPINRQVRALLGYPHPTRVPRSVYAETWIGYSTDEADRALGVAEHSPKYSQPRFPLLEFGMSRTTCEALLDHHGFPHTPKSACIGCPYHTNRHWREMRDERPAEFADAAEFDAALRASNGSKGQLRGTPYLHRSMLPLAQAPVDRVTYREWADRQGDLLADLALAEFEESLDAEDARQLGGCSPWSCHPAS